MKRTLLALIIGNLLTFFLTSPVTYFFWDSNILNAGTMLSVVILLGSATTGYIVREKGYLFGALLMLIVYLEILLFFSSILITNLLSAASQNVPIKGDFGNVNSFIYSMVLTVILPSMILGSLGGFFGEKIYNYQNGKKTKS